MLLNRAVYTSDGSSLIRQRNDDKWRLQVALTGSLGTVQAGSLPTEPRKVLPDLGGVLWLDQVCGASSASHARSVILQESSPFETGKKHTLQTYLTTGLFCSCVLLICMPAVFVLLSFRRLRLSTVVRPLV